MFHRTAFTGTSSALLFFVQSLACSHKVGLLSFNIDVKKLTHIFKRNKFPERLINKVVSTYLDINNTFALSDSNDRNSVH